MKYVCLVCVSEK